MNSRYRSLLSGILGVLLATSCGRSVSFLPPTVSETDFEIPTCQTQLVDYGQKGAALTRGQYSTVALIPGTQAPATAYSDIGAQGLKFAYWNGTQYKVESISGEPDATFIKLVFLSTGIPVVFWAPLGAATVKAAFRSAAVTSVGTWSIGVIDSGVGVQSIEASVNPLDQIAVFFLNRGDVAGRPRFAYCSSCKSPASFITMNPTTYVEDTNIIATQPGAGLAWCKASSSSYYPAVAYSVTGNVQYAVCQNTLANCLQTANWTKQSVAGVGNAQSVLLLDPTVTGDVPKIVSRGAASLETYRMGTTACTAAPAAFTAGATLGGAATGDRGISAVQSSGRFHVVANEGTTSLDYYTSADTDFLGAWDAVGTALNQTLYGATQFGAALDATGGGIYISVGANVAPYNLQLVRVSDVTLAANSGSLLFSRYSIDSTGTMQLYTSPRRNVSMASTSAGIPAVAYIDHSASVSDPSGALLKYSLRSSSSASGDWTVYTVPNTSAPQSPSLVFDSSDRPWVAYFDATLNTFFLTMNPQSDGSDTWVTYQFPATPAGAQGALPVSNDAFVAMLKSGSTRLPVMATLDTNAGSRGVRVAVLNPTTSSWSSPVVVDTLDTSGGASLTLDADATGNAIVAYRDFSAGRLKYSASADGLTWTTPRSISSLNQGAGAHVRLNPVTGYPAVSYFDRANNSVYYSSCAGTPVACETAEWTTLLADGTAGVSGITAANDQILAASLTFDTDGIPYVVYPRGQTADGNLAAAALNGESFTSFIIANGSNGNTLSAPALNYSVAGWGAAATSNAAGLFTSAYVGPGNWLYVTSCGD